MDLSTGFQLKRLVVFTPRHLLIFRLADERELEGFQADPVTLEEMINLNETSLVIEGYLPQFFAMEFRETNEYSGSRRKRMFVCDRAEDRDQCLRAAEALRMFILTKFKITILLLLSHILLVLGFLRAHRFLPGQLFARRAQPGRAQRALQRERGQNNFLWNLKFSNFTRNQIFTSNFFAGFRCWSWLSGSAFRI